MLFRGNVCEDIYCKELPQEVYQQGKHYQVIYLFITYTIVKYLKIFGSLPATVKHLLTNTVFQYFLFQKENVY